MVSTILVVRPLARMGTFDDQEAIMPVWWFGQREPVLSDNTVSTLWFLQNQQRLEREVGGR
jgi:hypothetical protein